MTYVIAVAGDANPVSSPTAIDSAPASAEWLLGIPPTLKNIFQSFAISILIAWFTSHAMPMVSRMFMFVVIFNQNKNLTIRQPGIEPGRQALAGFVGSSFSDSLKSWEARIMPLDHWRVDFFQLSFIKFLSL